MMLPLAFTTPLANASEAFDSYVPTARIHNASYLTSQAQPAKAALAATPTLPRSSSKAARHSTTNANKSLATKVFLPLKIKLAELSHPVQLFKSAQRHFWPEDTNAATSDYADGQVRTGRVFDVGLNAVSTYRLTDDSIRLASQDKAMDRFGVPSSYVAPESASRISATQLQVRMSDEWSLLYELDRLDADIGADKLSWGLGLRHAF